MALTPADVFNTPRASGASTNFVAGEFSRLADAMPDDTLYRVTLSSYIGVPDPRRGAGKLRYPTRVLRRDDYADLNPSGDGAGRDGLTRAEVIERVAEVVKAQSDLLEARIILTPRSPTHHITHIDDCSPAALERLVAAGYAPSVVIGTSPGKANVLLVAPRAAGMGDYAARQIGKAVSQALNCAYGDPGAANEIQPHRWPGFANLKPKYQAEDGSYPAITLRQAERQDCAEYARQLAAQPVTDEPAHVAAARRAVRRVKRDPRAIIEMKRLPNVRAYAAHAAAIRRDAEAGKLNMKRREDGQLEQRNIDGMAGRRMRQTGWGIEDVAVAVAVGTNLVREHYQIDLIRTVTQYAVSAADHAFELDMSRFTDLRWRLADESKAGVVSPVLEQRYAAAGHAVAAIAPTVEKRAVPPPGRRAPGAAVIAMGEATTSILGRNGKGRQHARA